MGKQQELFLQFRTKQTNQKKKEKNISEIGAAKTVVNTDEKRILQKLEIFYEDLYSQKEWAKESDFVNKNEGVEERNTDFQKESIEVDLPQQELKPSLKI